MEDTLRAYDWIRLGEQVREQLARAHAKLLETDDHPNERRWLGEAIELLAKDTAERESLMSRARRLPELAAIRQEHAADLIDPWVDALEHLHAGIVFNAGLKSPLLEALFPHKKFDSLRRANLDQAQSYGADFHRRLTSSYIERLLTREEFTFAQPSVQEVVARFAALGSDGEAELADEERLAICVDLSALAEKVELAIQQAKLLAEAALLPLPGTFEELGIRSKPKARAGKAAKETAPPNLEAEAPKKEKAAKVPKKEKAPPKEKPAAKAKSPKKKPERNSEASA